MAEKMTTLCKRLFGKKEKPYVRFYSLEPGVLDLFPIVPSANIKRQFMVDDQIGDLPETLSSKNCPGIRKIISSGWIVSAPADFVIQTNGDGVSMEWLEPYRFNKVSENRDAYVSAHTRSQVEPLLDNPNTTLKTVVKLETPWRVEASDDVILLQLPVTYNNERRFTAATGFLDMRYGHVLNVQLFWNMLDDKTLVRAGTPLCQLIPVSKKFLALSNYDVTIENATHTDLEKERAFNYAANCVILNNDSLAARLKRSMAILTKYKNKGR
jgi:hypothetical protein